MTTTKKKLPPDPEGMNDSRAQWAGGCLTDFQSATGCDDERSALGDLLTNLMHWCDRNDCDFDEALQTARMHYEAETSETQVVGAVPSLAVPAELLAEIEEWAHGIDDDDSRMPLDLRQRVQAALAGVGRLR